MHEKLDKARYSSDPEEQYEVGLMLRDGVEVEQNYKEAKEWFRKAAYRNHAASQFNLGVISASKLDGAYSSGYEAKNWLEKAAKQDYPGAKKLLDMIDEGEELPEANVLFSLDKPTESSRALEPLAPTKDEPQAIEPTESEAHEKVTASSSPAPNPEPAIQEPDLKPKDNPPAIAKEKRTPETATKPDKTNQFRPLYDKDLSNAVTEYQPSDLSEYSGEPWDIRISANDAPLEEAFYFTVKDAEATNESIQAVLEKYALNTERRNELDSDEYPQLPQIQQELKEYFVSSISGRIQLSIYVNKRPSEAPVQLQDKVEDHLSTCVFTDGSFDYRLLDLVFVADPDQQESSSITEPRYDKDLPDAVTEYQPSDLSEYSSEPWDIRISMDYAPLEDAFYFTVKDPEATNESIQTVLEKYALNTDRRGELDIDEYPQLPHIQEELLDYYNSSVAGKALLSVHVNKRPSEESVQLQDEVSKHLSTCIFNDGSYDYRLLDLVFVIESKPLDTSELNSLREKHGPSFILFLMDYWRRNSQTNSGNDLLASAPFGVYLAGHNELNDRFPEVTRALRAAEEAGHISKENSLQGEADITQEGYEHLESLRQEVETLNGDYERYRSVSANPPALGVPDGFDARIQIMRKHSVDVIHAIFLFAYVFDEDALFGAQNWANDFESGESFSAIMDAFQYESDFTDEVLDSLMGL